jgi:hypothetical protein
MVVTRRPIDWLAIIPPELLKAMDGGELTQEQLRQLISIEAQTIGLTFEQAVDRARTGELPRTALGADIELLVMLLAA